MRVLIITCGYICIALAGLSTYFPPGDNTAVLFGMLPYPWMEWAIMAAALFSYDMFVISRFKSLSVKK